MGGGYLGAQFFKALMKHLNSDWKIGSINNDVRTDAMRIR